MVEFRDLVGKTLASVRRDGDDRITFTTVTDDEYIMFHSQFCCESVWIEDICGDLEDLVGTPIIVAEEVESGQNPPDAKPETIEYQDSFTWTFYKLRTHKGDVTIRWYGESNGYYSEDVSFEKIK